VADLGRFTDLAGATPLACGESRVLRDARESVVMIPLKDASSFDSSHGSQQQLPPTVQGVPSEGEGTADARTAPFVTKPVWSVLSLQDLLEAVRRAQDPRDAAPLHQEVQRAEYARLRDIELHDAEVAEAARADRNRDRNAWQHT
jgi:hypothetical protein